MIEAFFSSASLWLAAGALLVFAVGGALGSVSVLRSEYTESDYRRRAALMPTYHELQAAEASLDAKRTERDELLEEIRTLRLEEAEIERHRLDAEHWRSLAEQAKHDYENRQDLIDQVDGLRAAYEDAAKDVAERNEELADLTRSRSALAMDIDAAQKKLYELEQQRQQAEDLTGRLEKLAVEREELLSELTKIRDQREERLRAGFEVEQLERRKSELEQALAALPATVQNLTEERNGLLKELETLRREADRLREARDEIDRLQERKLGLGTDIEALEREKERLEGDLVGLAPGARHGVGGDVDEMEQISDLLQAPTCLFKSDDQLLLPEVDVVTDEAACLGRVADYLQNLQLHFEKRTLYRFHTSLKTSFISPLTVLAGISGTGKSQLPQRYAEAMGMHFLKVAVQPRWDSPQDLLGFYNYLEKSYKATELARALVRMDVGFKLPEGHLQAEDRMLLVLLDEMNLARVEYYFSEFLSRLEGRPETREITDEQRLPGEIQFDVPRRHGDRLAVYPGHNVLFVGTMNEDESTQSLSDKVLDRANTLRFRKPETLRSQTLREAAGQHHRHLSFDTWYSWRKPTDSVSSDHQNVIEGFVRDLNEQLARINRPFGHRIAQAIHAYVANYPAVETTDDVHAALADTLALRILPKLRGIELEDRTPQVLRRIAELAQDSLGDDGLATSIRNGLNDDIFHWTG